VSKRNDIKFCDVCGRSSEECRVNLWKAFNRVLCLKHYVQLKKYNKILHRTEKDLNEIIIHTNFAEIVLYSKTKAGNEPEEIGRTSISLEDVDKVKNIKWKLMNTGYVSNNKYGLLSRYLLEIGEHTKGGLEADHIDNNPLNNQSSNLRKATSSQQKQNTRKLKIKGCSSRYKGVSKIGDRWLAVIIKDKISIRLGLFNSEIEAAREYNSKALDLFKEFANINILE